MNGNDKLLSAMRRSKYGWKWRDLERLYKSFGFLKREGGQHTIYWSPRFPMLRASVTRHRSLPVGYIATAVRLIETAKRKAKDERTNEDA